MIHRNSSLKQEWREENLLPFDELILSWNAIRPAKGHFLFYISVKISEWSSWLLYASWGSDKQSSFLGIDQGSFIKVYQDTLEVLEGKKATGFQIKIITEEKSLLNNIHGLHVYTNGDRNQERKKAHPCLTSIYLKVPKISQILLHHPRYKDLCSPTSTTAVIRFLLKKDDIDPIDFALNSCDSGFNIFGNWVFNIAQAAIHLGPEWNCWVERLNGFDTVYQYLLQGIPVIVSVRGPLPGSALPYSTGHLMAIIGYDALNQRVMCMDPAFSKDSETYVLYDLLDFLEAWSRRGNVAYVFEKKNKE